MSSSLSLLFLFCAVFIPLPKFLINVRLCDRKELQQVGFESSHPAPTVLTEGPLHSSLLAQAQSHLFPPLNGQLLREFCCQVWASLFPCASPCEDAASLGARLSLLSLPQWHSGVTGVTHCAVCECQPWVWVLGIRCWFSRQRLQKIQKLLLSSFRTSKLTLKLTKL